MTSPTSSKQWTFTCTHCGTKDMSYEESRVHGCVSTPSKDEEIKPAQSVEEAASAWIRDLYHPESAGPERDCSNLRNGFIAGAKWAREETIREVIEFLNTDSSFAWGAAWAKSIERRFLPKSG